MLARTIAAGLMCGALILAGCGEGSSNQPSTAAPTGSGSQSAMQQAQQSASSAAKSATDAAKQMATDAGQQAEVIVAKVKSLIDEKKLDAAQTELAKLEKMKADLSTAMQQQVEALRKAIEAAKTANQLKLPGM